MAAKRVAGAVGSGSPFSLAVEFRSGMSEAPMFFSIDSKRDVEDLSETGSRCRLDAGINLLNGAVRIIDGSSNSYPEDVGPWSVADVF